MVDFDLCMAVGQVLQSLWVSGLVSFGASGGLRASCGLQGWGFRCCGLQGCRASGLPGFRVAGLQGCGLQGCRCQGCGLQGCGLRGCGLRGLRASGLRASGFAGFSVAGFGVAGFGVAGFGVAGFRVAGFRVMGLQGCGLQGCGLQGWGLGVAGLRVAGFSGFCQAVHGNAGLRASVFLWLRISVGLGFRVAGLIRASVFSCCSVADCRVCGESGSDLQLIWKPPKQIYATMFRNEQFGQNQTNTFRHATHTFRHATHTFRHATHGSVSGLILVGVAQAATCFASEHALWCS